MRIFQTIGMVIGFLLILGGVLWYVNSRTVETPKTSGLEFASGWATTQTAADASRESEGLEIENSEIGNSLKIDNWKLEINEKYGFSFKYPADLRITEFPDEEGDMVLVQKPATGEGFQIFITPFDEAPEEYGQNGITLARIRRDLPNITVESPQNIIVNNISLLIFFGSNPLVGQTREAWFVWPPEPYPHGNYLYQVMSAAEFDPELSKIVATFQFTR